MAKIVSFHSYKGGSCRSTTCFNTIPYLIDALEASSSRPIILIDADLNSMGMTLLLTKDGEDIFSQSISAREVFEGKTVPDASVVDSLCNEKTGEISKNPYYKQFICVGNKFGCDDNGAVRFLGVSKKDRDSNVPCDPSASTKNISDVIDPLIYDETEYKGEFKGACAVVFDCASGIQHSARLANKLSHVLVMCMRPSIQFRSSTFHYLKFQLPEIKSGVFTKCKVVLLPTAVPDEPYISEIASDLLYQAHESITEDCDEVKNRNWPNSTDKLQLCTDMVRDGIFGIPEVQRFKLEEILLSSLQSREGYVLSDDEEKACARYEMLAQIIKN